MGKPIVCYSLDDECQKRKGSACDRESVDFFDQLSSISNACSLLPLQCPDSLIKCKHVRNNGYVRPWDSEKGRICF